MSTSVKSLIQVLRDTVIALEHYLDVSKEYEKKEEYDPMIEEALDRMIDAIRQAAYELLCFYFSDNTAEDVFYKLLKGLRKRTEQWR